MPFKVRNSKKIVRPDTRELKELRLDIELDQGHPLTAAQDVTLKHILAGGTTTFQQAAERLIALRPKSKA